MMNLSLPVIFSVPEGRVNIRLDMFLRDYFEHLSREKIKEEIKKGNILIDGCVCSSPKQHVKAGQEITATFSVPHASLVPEEGALDILYRDAEILVINKPAGLTVHPCPSCPEGTLANRLVAHFPELLQQEGVRPGIVHRLDKDTSGLMLVALSEKARLALCDQFAEHTIYKEYLAIVHGVPKKSEGEIDAPIGRDPKSKVRMAVVQGGKPARTSWRTLYADEYGRFSLLAVRIYTGRTHQIRVHMSYLGYPLLGDSVYGVGYAHALSPMAKRDSSLAFGGESKKEAMRTLLEKTPAMKNITRQMLHAWHLAFAHPYPNEISLSYFSTRGVNIPLDNISTDTSSSVDGTRAETSSLSDNISTRESSSFENTRMGTSSPIDNTNTRISSTTQIVNEEQSFSISHAREHNGLLSFTSLPPQDFSDALRSLVRMPLHVIVTGMPGCGKSTVIKELTRMDIPVFSADAEVAQLYAKEGDGTYLIRSRFGEEFLAEDGSLDKKKLGAAMRQSEQFRREVEALIHPLVSHATQAFFSRCVEENSNLAVAEIPLFFETGGTEKKGKDLFVVGVHCPFSLRAQRLKKNRGWTEEVIAGMERWQWSEKKKMSACHAVIENTGSEQDLKYAVEKLYSDLLDRKKEKEEKLLARIQQQFDAVIPPEDVFILNKK